MNSAETIRHLKIAAQETRKSIVSHCEMEKERPFTLNDGYRLSIRDDLLKDFANTRRGRKNSPSKCVDFNFQSKARPITTSAEDIVTGVAKRMTTSADDDKLFQDLSARGHPIQSLEDLSRLDATALDAPPATRLMVMSRDDLPGEGPLPPALLGHHL